MIWLLVPAAILLALWLWLAVLPLGTGFHGTVGGRPVDIRVIANAPLAKLMRKLGKVPPGRSNAVTLFGRMHFSGPGTPWLVAHELGHHVRGSNRIGYVLRYCFDSEFRGSEEVACNVFASKHENAAVVRAIYKRLAA